MQLLIKALLSNKKEKSMFQYHSTCPKMECRQSWVTFLCQRARTITHSSLGPYTLFNYTRFAGGNPEVFRAHLNISAAWFSVCGLSVFNFPDIKIDSFSWMSVNLPLVGGNLSFCPAFLTSICFWVTSDYMTVIRELRIT